MQKVFEKIIERLEEYPTYSFGVSLLNTEEYIKVSDLVEIVNQVASEYGEEVCEWKLDGVYLHCQHNTGITVTCLEEEKYRYNFCPICGKKIKVVEPYKAESEV